MVNEIRKAHVVAIVCESGWVAVEGGGVRWTG